MGKKYTILAVSAVALLLAVIVFAVAKLYSSGPSTGDGRRQQEGGLLYAVPSDAVAVYLFDGSQKASAIIADSTGLLKPFICGDSPAVMSYLSAVSRNRTAVALINSGSLVPVVITLTDKADSARIAAYCNVASAAGLKTTVEENYLIASRSETFLGSVARGIEKGSSLSSDPAVTALCNSLQAPLTMLFSNDHSAKIMQEFSTASLRKKATFVKELGRWTAVAAEEVKPSRIILKGGLTVADKGFAAAHAGAKAGDLLFPEVLPYFTSCALAVSIDDADAFIVRQQAFEDSRGRLSKYNREISEKGSRQLSPKDWVRSLRPQELVKATFRTEDGVLHEALLLRSAQDLKFGKEARNLYPGALAAVFGESFTARDSVCASIGRQWSVFADLETVRSFTDGTYSSYPLKERLSDASVPVPGGYAAYASFSDAPELVSEILSKTPADAVKDYVRGAAFAPAFASIDLSSGEATFKLRLDKCPLKGGKAQVMERDTVVVVPSGMFPVKNSATGKVNYLYQNSHKAICLNDNNGKGIWGIPFKEYLCGRVQNVDFYHNGKIQFLFAAGSKLYLLDRLGHWVNGFPVELGKDVLLGPDVYDFTGAGGYTVMVLHKDNTLERYNLHGKKPQGWMGISAPETIKNLPELYEAGGRRYWVVRTSVRTLVYPFEGGETLTKEEGARMIKPDSPISVNGKTMRAECYDGRQRDIKLY